MAKISDEALFVEPNAYITNYKKERKLKKIVFQEPYENMPPHYINNNFQKKDCDCVPQKEGKGANENQNFSPFNLGNLMPSLSNLTSLFSGGIGNLLSAIGGSRNQNSNKDNSCAGLDIKNLLSLLGGNNGLASILNMFKTGIKSESHKTKMKEKKSTDISIKEYTRVD